MPDRIILLAGEVESPHLTNLLREHKPSLTVDAVHDKVALEKAFSDDVSEARLIGVLTGVIVPSRLLAMLPGPAYNFHPGPPEYPGSCVAGFAVYDGAETFGVTLHEMADRVDSGPIVEVRRFPVRAGCKFQDVEVDAFRAVIAMFTDYARHLATNDAPLPLSGETWTGRPRTLAEAEDLKRILPDLSEEEIVRRYKAFG